MNNCSIFLLAVISSTLLSIRSDADPVQTAEAASVPAHSQQHVWAPDPATVALASLGLLALSEAHRRRGRK